MALATSCEAVHNPYMAIFLFSRTPFFGRAMKIQTYSFRSRRDRKVVGTIFLTIQKSLNVPFGWKKSLSQPSGYSKFSLSAIKLLIGISG